MLAQEHARDDREFYGRRLDRGEITWEVIGEEEGEDYYYVRLAYRPSHGFRGEPGVELFTIDKAGPVRLRQILNEPQPRRGRILTATVAGLALVAGATVAVLFISGLKTGGSYGRRPSSASNPGCSTYFR